MENTVSPVLLEMFFFSLLKKLLGSVVCKYCSMSHIRIALGTLFKMQESGYCNPQPCVSDWAACNEAEALCSFKVPSGGYEAELRLRTTVAEQLCFLFACLYKNNNMMSKQSSIPRMLTKKDSSKNMFLQRVCFIYTWH